jgi:hypothetical protein
VNTPEELAERIRSGGEQGRVLLTYYFHGNIIRKSVQLALAPPESEAEEVPPSLAGTDQEQQAWNALLAEIRALREEIRALEARVRALEADHVRRPSPAGSTAPDATVEMN